MMTRVIQIIKILTAGRPLVLPSGGFLPTSSWSFCGFYHHCHHCHHCHHVYINLHRHDHIREDCQCHHDQVGISLLLASPSPLATLACWGCPLTEEERGAIVKVAASFLDFTLSHLCKAASEANLDLSFDWRGRDVAEEELLEELPDLEDMEDLLAQLIH